MPGLAPAFLIAHLLARRFADSILLYDSAPLRRRQQVQESLAAPDSCGQNAFDKRGTEPLGPLADLTDGEVRGLEDRLARML
jgi:hypothetical protein